MRLGTAPFLARVVSTRARSFAACPSATNREPESDDLKPVADVLTEARNDDLAIRFETDAARRRRRRQHEPSARVAWAAMSAGIVCTTALPGGGGEEDVRNRPLARLKRICAILDSVQRGR